MKLNELTVSVIEGLKGKELVDAYNTAAKALDTNLVVKFSDRATGVKRTIKLVQEAQAKAKPAPKQKKPAGERKKREMRFVFPASENIKGHREGTMRAKLIALLSTEKGATFEECIEATWGQKEDMTPEVQRQTTYEGVRLLHYYLGYGMKQDEQGRIRLVTK